ncbi:MAG: TlpA family protein disulfide reductase [Deltaproteobacteria bacterium]|nr:TlpA family protein disulfide reductase [Deltaproteobacteria bacterium]
MKNKLAKLSDHILLLTIIISLLLLSPGINRNAYAFSKYGILGQKAPELNLNTWIDGYGNKIKPIKLKQLKGKVIYMYFFQAWCPGCHSHGFPTIKALTKEFKSNPDVAFLAVQTVFEGFTFNTENKLRENQIKYDIHVPMAHDTGKGKPGRTPETMINYRSGGTPWTVIIDPEGTIVYNQFHIDAKKATAMIRRLIKK